MHTFTTFLPPTPSSFAVGDAALREAFSKEVKTSELTIPVPKRGYEPPMEKLMRARVYQNKEVHLKLFTAMSGPKAAVRLVHTGDDNTSVINLRESEASTSKIVVTIHSSNTTPEYTNNAHRMAFLNIEGPFTENMTNQASAVLQAGIPIVVTTSHVTASSFVRRVKAIVSESQSCGLRLYVRDPKSSPINRYAYNDLSLTIISTTPSEIKHRQPNYITIDKTESPFGAEFHPAKIEISKCSPQQQPAQSPPQC